MIAAALAAVNENNSDRFRRAFAPNAVFHDRTNAARSGRLDAWAADALFRYSTTTVHLIGFVQQGRQSCLSVVIETQLNDVALPAQQNEWNFTVVAGLVTSLEIKFSTRIFLDPAVVSYIIFVNTFDAEMLLDCFKSDALVYDQASNYWGREQIKEWLAREIVAYRMRIRAVGASVHYGHTILTAQVWGDFDRNQVELPLTLSFYFYVFDNKIAELIILQNDTE